MTRLDFIALDGLGTRFAQYGALSDWARGQNVAEGVLPFGLTNSVPIAERPLAYVAATDRLFREMFEEAAELGIPLAEIEQMTVAARAAVRAELEEVNPSALTLLDEAEEVYVATCVRDSSFSGDTLVAMADGTTLPIADVQVGDRVLAYDFDTGTTVGREVTATLPHTDWLLEAHFSDGSLMSVTEDHRFWSITDADWVELQDLDTDDILLTPDGATVRVDYLD